MKRLRLNVLLIALVAFILLCVALIAVWRLSDYLAHQRAQRLAQSIANSLGRTSANSIVEYESCGMLVCVYRVYFSIPDGPNEMYARFSALDTLKLRVSGGGSVGGALLRNLNSDLSQTGIVGRLAVSAGAYSNPGGNGWGLANEKGEGVASIELFITKNQGVSYTFDGKLLPNENIVLVYAVTYPHK
jgi:hypothetical protein